jgi:hypothetical protein
LNDELLGYDSEKAMRMSDIGYRKIGVGKYPGHRQKGGRPCFIQSLTTSNEQGDFKKKIAERAGFTREEPYVLVVKKHVSILKNLVEWLGIVAGEEDEENRRRVTDLAILVIDDECDQASVNTKLVERDPDTGLVNEECDPTKTNMRIRELLALFDKSAYIGYTATPYANVFIHEDTKHPKYGDDIFPRNFIFNLTEPDSYIGASKIFGIKDEDPDSGVTLPLLGSALIDAQDVFPAGHKKDLLVSQLPDSMLRAVKSFVIACAVRRLRRTKNPHNTMLIHVTRFTDVQKRVKELVAKEIRTLRNRIISSDPLDDLEKIWDEQFLPSSTSLKMPQHTWEEIKTHLPTMIRKVTVMAINGASQDVLQYKDAEDTAAKAQERGDDVRWEDAGAHVIAIGGNKLSRGLTLEGLTITYYLRCSSMYDTLMQMGRWFGYRPGYLDLCRIDTTREIIEYFRQISKADMDLREQFENMALVGMEPRDFGLSVLEDPGMLMITNAGKRRDTELIDQNFSGKVSATINFNPSKAALNLSVLSNLISSCDADQKATKVDSTLNHHWKKVGKQIVIEMLNTYAGSNDATLVQPLVMANFIKEQEGNDLAEWDVVILSKKNPGHEFSLQNKKIGCFKRVATAPVSETSLAIGTLLSPSHEWIDFDETEQERCIDDYLERTQSEGEAAAGREKPPGPFIRYCRPRERALLLIYAICSKESRGDKNLEGSYGTTPGEEIFGFVASFPAGKFKTVRARANSVFVSRFWED